MDVSDFYGPIDNTLLTLQHKHRSGDILTNPAILDDSFRIRINDAVIWGNSAEPKVLHGRVLQKLDQMGFYGVYSCMSQKIDSHLITALVERWRKETHTFHFRVGEATITLEDIGILWRLPVDGACVSGIMYKWDKPDILDWCEKLIGYKPRDRDIDGFRIRVKPLGDWLVENAVTDESGEEQVEQHARAYALLLLGCILCPDCSGNYLSLDYLQNLEDLNIVRDFSWGSAILAYLYRELSTACDIGKMNIGGALRLLQVWAWSRILPLQPIRGPPIVEMTPKTLDGIELPIPAHAARWNTKMSYISTSRNSVRIMREILDSMTMDQFVWTPYNPNLPEIEALTEEFRSPAVRSTCPLIFYNIIEMHYPERVLRQFGLVQFVPSMPLFRNMKLKNSSKRIRNGDDWRNRHAKWIERWNNRHESITTGEEITTERSYSEDYYSWYESVTRRFISPAARVMDRGYQPGDAVAWQAVLSICKEGRQRSREGQDVSHLWARLEDLSLDRCRTMGYIERPASSIPVQLTSSYDPVDLRETPIARRRSSSNNNNNNK